MHLPFCAPVPKYATLRKRTVQHELPAKDGILTLSDACFQRDLSRRRTWYRTFRLQFAAEAEIYKLSSSLFIRHY